MKKSVAYSFAYLLLALPVVDASSAAHTKPAVRHTVIAASGSAAPAGGNYSGFSLLSLNERDQVAFDATLIGLSTTGVFVGDGRKTSTIALAGNPDPAAGDFGFVNDPFITPTGRVVFTADGSDTFRSNGSTTVPLVRNGDPAPGGGTLSPTSHAANSRGAITYQAFLLDATATEGIFYADGANTVSVVTNSDLPPTGGTFDFFSTPAVNRRGQVAFTAAMIGGDADFAVFRGDGGSLTPVFVANQVAPGGATFLDFSDPLINRHGQVAASANLANGTGVFGLFVGDGTDTVAIALEGQAAPKGGTYLGGPLKPLTLNERGEVAFHTRLTGGTSSRGVFRGNGTHTTAIALAGTIAPGTTGRFESFRDMKLGDDGRVAIIATLTVGVGGVTVSNNVGIWVGTSDADLRLVVRTGDVIDGRTLTRLPGNQFGQFDLNEHGIAWIGGFPEGASAIVFSRIRGEHGAESESAESR
jgi:hypothetical protein